MGRPSTPVTDSSGFSGLEAAPRPSSLFGVRLEACLDSWPESLVQSFERYLLLREKAERPESPPAVDECYWVRLPGWVLSEQSGAGTPFEVKSEFLDDVLWAQYCLYLFVRVQDDLLDGQAHDRFLLFAADQFLFEAERTFSRHLGRLSPFWQRFRDSLQATTRAIVEVDFLQRRPGGMSGDFLDAHARVSSIFKVGTAAVCAKLRRLKDFPPIAAFCDEVAVVGQILDDLWDLEEDLKNRRYTFVANTLADLADPRHKGLGAEGVWEAMAQGWIFQKRMDLIWGEVRRRLERASGAIEAIGLSSAVEYLEEAAGSLEEFEAGLHRARVRHLLGRFLPQRERGTERPRGKTPSGGSLVQ